MQKNVKGGYIHLTSSDLHGSVMNITDIKSYLIWSNIPVGTIVFLTTGNNAVCRVDGRTRINDDPRLGMFYMLTDIMTGQTGEFLSYDFRILVIMSDAIRFPTNEREIDYTYGLISGISADGQNIYVMGVNSINTPNHLIYNIYNNNQISQFKDNVRLMTYDDVLSSGIFNLNILKYINDYKNIIFEHPYRDKILNLKICRNNEWEFTNILNSKNILNIINSQFDNRSGTFPPNEGPSPQFNSGFDGPSGTPPFGNQPRSPSGTPPFGNQPRSPSGTPQFGNRPRKPRESNVPPRQSNTRSPPKEPPRQSKPHSPPKESPRQSKPHSPPKQSKRPPKESPRQSKPHSPPRQSKSPPKPRSQRRQSKVPSKEEISLTIIKHFFPNAINLTYQDRVNAQDPRLTEKTIHNIKEKLLGVKGDEKDIQDKYKKILRKVLIALHPDKIANKLAELKALFSEEVGKIIQDDDLIAAAQDVSQFVTVIKETKIKKAEFDTGPARTNF